MPKGIGIAAIYGASGDELHIRRRFLVCETIKVPAEQLKIRSGRRNAFQKLVKIDSYCGFTAIAGKCINAYLHFDPLFPVLLLKGCQCGFECCQIFFVLFEHCPGHILDFGQSQNR